MQRYVGCVRDGLFPLPTLLVAAATVGLAACGGEAAPDGEPSRSAADEADGSAAPASAGEAERGFPEGWEVRTDEGGTSPEAVDLVATDDGYRVRPGPRAIAWDPETRARGSYRALATFRQLNTTRAPEGYGLFVGGRDLQGSEQDYLYFLIRRDGRYLVKHRAGDETHTLVEWTSHEALEDYGDEAPSPETTLAVESRDEGVRFLVDGTEVDRLPRAPMLRTDGQVGVRVNHRLDVSFRDLRVEPIEGGSGDGG